MKASRAYIASLGTTSVLIGFALLLLVVVSAILGFRGWPAGGSSGDAQSLTIDGQRELTRLAPIRFEAARPGTASAWRAARASDARGSKARALDAGAVRGASGSGASAPAQASPASGSAPAAPAAGSGQASPAAGVDDARSGVAGAAEDATQGAADALGGADSGLGQSVSQTGQAVSGLVESGDSVKSQLPQLPNLP
jgi:hypothetical protein